MGELQEGGRVNFSEGMQWPGMHTFNADAKLKIELP